MITLQAGAAIAAVAANNTSVTVTLTGMELSAGNETYKILSQGVLTTSAANLYTAPANTTSFVKRIFSVNTTGNAQSGIIFYISSTGAAGNTSTQMTGNFSIPVNGSMVYDESGWTVWDANMTLQMSGPAAGRLKSRTIIAPGTTTYTTPPGVNAIFIECVGPGGGGGGANAVANNSAWGAGGGAGGYCNKLVLAPAASYAVAVGNGGAGGLVSGAAGSNGSANTTFTIGATVLTASLGTGGNGMTNGVTAIAAPGGAGGTANNGDINIPGEQGLAATRFNTAAATTTQSSGKGGSIPPYGIGGSVSTATAAGGAGGGNGGGGGGGSATGSGSVSGAGGNGANGVIVVWEYQ